MRNTIILFVFVIMITGCASVYRQYEGPQLSDDKIAVLEHPNPLHSFFILEDVDGKWRGTGLIERYELMPGEHSITCSLHVPGKTSKKVTRYFKAEAGKTYIAEALTEGNKWTVLIIDKDANKIVSYDK